MIKPHDLFLHIFEVVQNKMLNDVQNVPSRGTDSLPAILRYIPQHLLILRAYISKRVINS